MNVLLDLYYYVIKKISQIQMVFDVEFEKPNFMIFEIRYFGKLNFLVKMNLVLM